MSHSITTTASYVLNKYSRSYPSMSSSGSEAVVDSEWQHFTNPVMRIILEAKKSPSGQLVSMRLRIMWSLHTESSELSMDQREVVFEDLELLSFSSLPPFQSPANASDQSLPLKAVYRDTLVGIRYLHPRIITLGSPPTYRRFQVTFKDAQDASRFIDAVKSVCPCKANVHSTQINRHPTMLSTALTRAATTVAGAQSTRLTERQSVTPASRPLPAQLSTLSRPLEDHPVSTIAPSSVPNNLSSDNSAFMTCSETSHRTGTPAHHEKDSQPKYRGSLPNSSQSSSSDQSSTMPPPPVPRRVTHSADGVAQEPSKTATGDDERSHILASLSKHPSLYELSRTDLELLVGQVIREEGFRHLLESLDSLWSVKGLLGH